MVSSHHVVRRSSSDGFHMEDEPTQTAPMLTPDYGTLRLVHAETQTETKPFLFAPEQPFLFAGGGGPPPSMAPDAVLKNFTSLEVGEFLYTRAIVEPRICLGQTVTE